MVRHAQTRTVGTLAATALFALAASEAQAQSRQDVLNEQLQLGDVLSGQVLNVEGVREAVSVTTGATGNGLSGSADGVPTRVVSRQTLEGAARAESRLRLGGDTDGYVRSATSATGNALVASGRAARYDLDVEQAAGATEVVANTFLPGGEARLHGGAHVVSSAQANATQIGGEGVSLNGSITQSSDASVRAGVLSEARYVPGRATFETEATANRVWTNAAGASNHALSVRQSSTGGIVEADTSANAANAWDMTSRATAAANQISAGNAGGSVVLETDQDNGSDVRARAINTAYDFGAVYAEASGIGNQVEVVNDDIYLKLDNTQLNTGGVDVEASVSGSNGYDGYVNAQAVGNSVAAYACSTCPADVTLNNTQVNSGNVTAIARTSVGGSGRTVVTTSQAIGNNATFHVTRPGD